MDVEKNAVIGFWVLLLVYLVPQYPRYSVDVRVSRSLWAEGAEFLVPAQLDKNQAGIGQARWWSF